MHPVSAPVLFLGVEGAALITMDDTQSAAVRSSGVARGLAPLVRGTGLFAGGTAVAFAFAGVRELVLARTLGVGASADLVLLAMSIPLAWAASATALLDSVLLPSLASATTRRAATVLILVERGLSVLLLACSPVVLIVLVQPALRTAGGEGWASAGLVLLIAVGLFVSLGLMSFRIRCRLGRSQRFFLAGALPAIPALGVIIGVAAMTVAGGMWWPPLGFLVGAGVAVSLAGPTRRLVAPTGPSGYGSSAQTWRYTWLYLRRSLPVTVGAMLFPVGASINRVLASFGPVGTVASLEYATRVFNIPNTLVTVSVTAVLLPLRISKLPQRTTNDLYAHTFWSIVIMVPLACALTALAPTIARFLLGSNQDPVALRAITLNTMGLAAGLPAIMVGNMRLRADQAVKNYYTTLLCGGAFALATVAAGCVFVLTAIWALFGFAQTAGLAAFLAVVASRGTNHVPRRYAHAALALAMAGGLGGACVGAALSGFGSNVLTLAGLAVGLGGWTIGLLTATVAPRALRRAEPPPSKA